MQYKKAFLFLAFIISTLTLKPQCADFHLGFCPIPDFSYYYNQQSKSFDLRVGQTAELRVVVYENTDYYLSICKHRKLETLQFRIYEDNETKDLLYDNASTGFVDTLKFTNEVTRRLIFELYLPAEHNQDDDKKPRCVGILIASRMMKKED